MAERREDALRQCLGAFGADLDKWSPSLAGRARTALLSDPEFRRAFELERDLDRRIEAERAASERRVADSGAVERLRRRALGSIPGDPLVGFGWQRLAAAMLVAGMLGGAFDLLLPERLSEPAEAAFLGPLYGDDAEGG